MGGALVRDAPRAKRRRRGCRGHIIRTVVVCTVEEDVRASEVVLAFQQQHAVARAELRSLSGEHHVLERKRTLRGDDPPAFGFAHAALHRTLYRERTFAALHELRAVRRGKAGVERHVERGRVVGDDSLAREDHRHVVDEVARRIRPLRRDVDERAALPLVDCRGIGDIRERRKRGRERCIRRVGFRRRRARRKTEAKVVRMAARRRDTRPVRRALPRALRRERRRTEDAAPARVGIDGRRPFRNGAPHVASERGLKLAHGRKPVSGTQPCKELRDLVLRDVHDGIVARAFRERERLAHRILVLLPLRVRDGRLGELRERRGIGAGGALRRHGSRRRNGLRRDGELVEDADVAAVRVESVRGVGERGAFDLQLAVALHDAHADRLGRAEDIGLRHALLPRRKVGDVLVSADERGVAVVGVDVLLFVEIPHAAVRELHDAVLVDALVAVHVAGQHQVDSARLRGLEEGLVVVAAPAFKPERIVLHEDAELRILRALRREQVL